ncbi:MAG TPA: hypothetical protein VN750_12520 [Steroidobacteraceae bacterium]|nr:hypothetical protein [Steroidobacteraceae bacterium]
MPNSFDPEIPPGACPHYFVGQRCLFCSAALRGSADSRHRLATIVILALTITAAAALWLLRGSL